MKAYGKKYREYVTKKGLLFYALADFTVQKIMEHFLFLGFNSYHPVKMQMCTSKIEKAWRLEENYSG